MANHRWIQHIDAQGNKVGLIKDDGWAGEGQPSQFIIKDVNGNVIWSYSGGVDGMTKLDERLKQFKAAAANPIVRAPIDLDPGSEDPPLTTPNTDADVRDQQQLANAIGISVAQLNGLEKALNDLIEQNKSYYGSRSRALRLGEGETSAKAYGGKYDVDLNQNGTIEDNERGYGNIDSTESVMGRSASSAANRLKQSGISDFNTLVENKNQRTEQDINSALMSLMNSNTNELAKLQNDQWGTEAAAGKEILTSAGAYGAATGKNYEKDNYGWHANTPESMRPPKPPDTETMRYVWSTYSDMWVPVMKPSSDIK